MAFEEEKKQLLGFHKSLSEDQAIQFMKVLEEIHRHGLVFLKEGLVTILGYELEEY